MKNVTIALLSGIFLSACGGAQVEQIPVEAPKVAVDEAAKAAELAAAEAAAAQTPAQAKAVIDWASKINVVDTQKQSVYVVRKTTTADKIGDTYQEILTQVSDSIAKQKVTPAGAPTGIYYKWTPESVDMAAGFPIAKPKTKTKAPFEVVELPAGKAVKLVHTGPYAGLPEAHGAITQWLTAQGKKENGPRWEVYTNDPGQVTDPTLLETQIFVPIAD